MKKEKQTERLSAKAKELLTELRIHKGWFLRKHISHSGQECWKLMDENMNPVSIHTELKVQECLNSGYLTRNENGLTFIHHS